MLFISAVNRRRKFKLSASNCAVGAYHSRAVGQDCLNQGHRGSVRGHAGYDPLYKSSAPSSASQHPQKNKTTNDRPPGSPKISTRVTTYYCVPVNQSIMSLQQSKSSCYCSCHLVMNITVPFHKNVHLKNVRECSPSQSAYQLWEVKDGEAVGHELVENICHNFSFFILKISC